MLGEEADVGQESGSGAYHGLTDGQKVQLLLLESALHRQVARGEDVNVHRDTAVVKPRHLQPCIHRTVATCYFRGWPTGPRTMPQWTVCLRTKLSATAVADGTRDGRRTCILENLQDLILCAADHTDATLHFRVVVAAAAKLASEASGEGTHSGGHGRGKVCCELYQEPEPSRK
eukprot:scaffold819_cov350-Prasinococcus_capsulatus_cf.AAC.12